MQQRIHNNKIELFTDNKEQAKQIQEHFSCFEPGYKHNTRYRSGKWNGKRNFYNVQGTSGGWLFTFDIGFQGRVQDFTQEPFEVSKVSEETISFIKQLKQELPFEPYRHQMAMILGLADKERHLAIASVGSGKSLVIYALVRLQRQRNQKVLILVPTVDLVNQLKGDFEDYSAPEKFLEDKNYASLHSFLTNAGMCSI